MLEGRLQKTSEGGRHRQTAGRKGAPRRGNEVGQGEEGRSHFTEEEHD